MESPNSIIIKSIILMLLLIHIYIYNFFTDTVPKNHHKENVKRIRQIQAQSKKKELESQSSVTVLSKSTKYDNVLSKVKV